MLFRKIAYDPMEIFSVINAVVFIPMFTIEGVARNHLIYSSTEEGSYDTYALNLDTGARRLIARKVHWQVAVKESSSLIVFLRDVSEGFELSKVFYFDLENDKEDVISVDLEPQRIIGLAFDGERAAWSGATEEAAGIYIAEPGRGKVECVIRTRGREFVSDVSSKYIVGYGYIRGNPFSTEIFAVDLATGSMQVYTPREGSTNLAPKLYGDRALFASNFENGDKFRLYTLDLSSGELERVRFRYPDMDYFDPVEFVGYGWTENGLIWAIAKKCGAAKLFLDGALVGLDSGFVSSAAVYKNRAFIVHSSLTKPPRILTIDLLKGNVEVLTKTELPEEIERRLGDVRFVEVKSFDGLKIPTYILESKVSTKPGPTVVYIHGGPWDEVADSWSPMIAALAALGYHVVAPNFRGSTGYGERFRLMIVGDPGGADMEDIAAARRWAVESGLSTDSYVSIVGYSYGGYATLMQLAMKPKLWRCGVAGAPVSDWTRMYEASDAFYKAAIEVLFGGKKELLSARSPAKYIENIEAPLCLIHPQKDSRTPLVPILDFAKRLTELGKDLELHVLPRVGHLSVLDREPLIMFLLYTAMFLARCYRN